MRDFEVASSGRIISTNLKHLAESMSKHLVSSKSQGTVKKYHSSFKKWQDFTLRENFSCIISQPIYVALYLTQLIDTGCSVSVIQSAIYSIKWAHKLHNYEDPTDNSYVTNLLETMRRNLSVPKTKKSIVTSEQIISLCKIYSDSQDILVLRDLSIIVLSFACFLCFDEVRSLHCKDIKLFDSHISLYLSKSKCDQYR